jgi:DNA replication protein DnaC
MAMSITELEKALRSLRCSGMAATLQARALQVASHECDFLEAVSQLVQDELDRRKSRLIERRFTKSGLPERKDFQHFDWSFNPKLPKRELFELATLKFIDAREDALLIGKPGTGKSHAAKAFAWTAVQRGYNALYREAHELIDEINLARETGTLRKHRHHLKTVELLVIDDLFLKVLPSNAGEELADILMSRYERRSSVITSNRPLEDWGKLLGDVVIITPLLDRLMHHGHLLKYEGPSWRLHEAAKRLTNGNAQLNSPDQHVTIPQQGGSILVAASGSI